MPANDYKIQISCLDSDANNFKSDEYLFSTPEEPTVSNITIDNKENVDLPTIVIAYKTNVPTTTYILFKGAQESGQHTYLISDRTLEHSAEITGLDPSVEYTLQISGVDEHSIAAKSVEQKITTRFDSRPPVIVTSRAIGKVMGRGKSAQANVYIRVETDEPTKIKIGYAKGIVTKSFEEAFEVAKESDEAFIIGGANVYKQGLNWADRLYITEVQADVEGDIFFPEFDKSLWKEIKRERKEKDAENIYDLDFVVYERVR